MAETIATRVYVLERDRDDMKERVFGKDGLDMRVDRVESRVDVMGAKLAVYATLGAALGGGVVAGVVQLLFG